MRAINPTLQIGRLISDHLDLLTLSGFEPGESAVYEDVIFKDARMWYSFSTILHSDPPLSYLDLECSCYVTGNVIYVEFGRKSDTVAVDASTLGWDVLHFGVAGQGCVRYFLTFDRDRVDLVTKLAAQLFTTSRVDLGRTDHKGGRPAPVLNMIMSSDEVSKWIGSFPTNFDIRSKKQFDNFSAFRELRNLPGFTGWCLVENILSTSLCPLLSGGAIGHAVAYCASAPVGDISSLLHIPIIPRDHQDIKSDE